MISKEIYFFQEILSPRFHTHWLDIGTLKL